MLEGLVATYPALRDRIFAEGDELPQFLNVFIDGTDVRLNEGLETQVGADATVILLPAVAGGRGDLTAAPPARPSSLALRPPRAAASACANAPSCDARCVRGATQQVAVRLGPVAAGNRDVELGVAPHPVLGHVQAGFLDLGLGADARASS